MSLSILGDIERFVSELYPYRWPLTIGALIILAAALGLGYRRGWHFVIWRHRLASGLVAAAVLALSIPAGDYFLSPLWERSFLEEESPLAGVAEAPEQPDIIPQSPSPTVGTGSEGSGDVNEDGDAPEETSRDGTAPDVTPTVIATGGFEGADDFHFGRGQALLIETAPDAYTLRFEDFSVRNGPDLFVYLSRDPDGYTSDALELGRLKATDGSFNYEIPPGTDVFQFKSAIVWCKPFSVLFAAAPLTNR
jgi:hypothetical protein